MCHFTASMISGVVVTTALNPFDLVSTRLYNQVYMYVCVHVCVYACMCVYVCMYVLPTLGELPLREIRLQGATLNIIDRPTLAGELVRARRERDVALDTHPPVTGRYDVGRVLGDHRLYKRAEARVRFAEGDVRICLRRAACGLEWAGRSTTETKGFHPCNEVVGGDEQSPGGVIPGGE